ncbi:MAG TPA: hypothetical protein VFX92_11760 [Candidatus Krumholzibacteria bacterium]|nr:hypothetical protein [Candidatus Krumholzibacteria bacterium]
MSPSRRIRSAIFVFLALGLVFPPSWVLCVEPTGEVHVEAPGTPCCATIGNPGGGTTLVPGGDDGCDGCQDIAPANQALRSTRSVMTAVSAPAPVAHVAHALLAATTRTSFRATTTPRDPGLALLSTTIILR